LVLVTETTTYAIRIKNKNQFLQAFDQYFNLSGDTDAELGINQLEAFMKERHLIRPDRSDTENEKSFVKMLSNLNSSFPETGLEMFKATQSPNGEDNFEQWVNLEILSNGTIKEVPCN